MATASDILRTASGEIGYTRWADPDHGTKYGRWYAGLTKSPYFGQNGVPFCAMGVSWVFDQCGQKCPGLPSASCTAIYNSAKKAGAVLANKRGARPGDLVIFDWANVAGPCDHIGIVEANMGSHVQTIEFNTSNASNTNGGGVYRRTRDWSVVQAVIRPPYGGGSSSTPPAPGKLAVDGWWGSGTTTALQGFFGTPVDGVVSGQNRIYRARNQGLTTGWEWTSNPGGSRLITKIQKKVGARPDGIFGPETANRLIKYFAGRSGATVMDGKLDAMSITIKAMQRSLNDGKF